VRLAGETEASIRYREHWTLRRHQRIDFARAPKAASRLGASVTANVLGVTVGDTTLNLNRSFRQGTLAGTSALKPSSYFLCTSDDLTPLEHPIDYVVWAQTWEWYSPTFAAPASWGVSGDE
jgi:hypothetical protein